LCPGDAPQKPASDFSFRFFPFFVAPFPRGFRGFPRTDFPQKHGLKVASFVTGFDRGADATTGFDTPP
jgi:hypothetical protein